MRRMRLFLFLLVSGEGEEEEVLHFEVYGRVRGTNWMLYEMESGLVLLLCRRRMSQWPLSLQSELK